ncbi:glyoxalase family protein [Leadbettera azotonutricia ZAS-9]|uniref:Glyoxalase family protein n=2 Tax=Leadbettera azotonutricia TaxID=150829 RepID=F5Y884_LEAAZ|nr:glyoxalase family protein [Leadbettera azotonutricia ZAS-9]
MKNHIDFKDFLQIAIIVKDIEKAAKVWADILHVPVPEIRIDKPSENPDLTYRGKKAFYGLKLAVIMSKERGIMIELHEPLEGESTFKEFQNKHGNGVHHLGFVVGPDRRDAVVGEFEEMGYPIRTLGYYPGGSWTIIDAEDDLGVNLNIKPFA